MIFNAVGDEYILLKNDSAWFNTNYFLYFTKLKQSHWSLLSELDQKEEGEGSWEEERRKTN